MNRVRFYFEDRTFVEIPWETQLDLTELTALASAYYGKIIIKKVVFAS